MNEPNFTNQQNWLDNLTIEPQTLLTNEVDKRKWDSLQDFPNAITKHFHSGSDNDTLLQTNKQTDDESNLSPSELQRKRKEQNRIAQRAFRERKERYVKELEEKVAQLEKDRINEMKTLQDENKLLHQRVKEMETEIYTLKGAERAFERSIQKLREAGIQLPVDTTTDSGHLPTSPPVDSNEAPSPFDPSSSITTTSSAIVTTPTNNQWHSSPFMDSSPYSASSSSMTPSSPLYDLSNERVYDDHQQNNNNNSNDDNSSNDNIQLDHPSLTTYLPPHISETTTTNLHDQHQEIMGFAQNETGRFNHQVDPRIEQGAKTIPCDRMWETLQEHPNIDMFDMDTLCVELQKKARCSGSGAVILEEDFIDVLKQHEDSLKDNTKKNVV
ncbi:uncharacterized protein BX664DRAFT_319733 [Halteromyces radiatus]|uniref:uncharacterized protein n=1 Tax=Halteromyces radiatus TaxID=101107 RepID=UPI00221F557E|nr:uncharacterized protein BX664DRAFT_319733 [Halteromyces radiatus]KAI8098842.1 hypothetical protein BX664DRAFT_319733 [Halteromyces radiatus]